MAKAIKNMADLRKQINEACDRAVKITANEAKNKLYECIDVQYYKDPGFCPSVYDRTETFLTHAAYLMLSSNKAQIYVDIEGMHYKNNFSPWQVVKWASESRHGAEYYQTETTDFWSVFIKWCNDNLLELLKTNLRKQGLNVR